MKKEQAKKIIETFIRKEVRKNLNESTNKKISQDGKYQQFSIFRQSGGISIFQKSDSGNDHPLIQISDNQAKQLLEFLTEVLAK